MRLVSEALTGEMDEKSFKIGMIAEMIHTASLIHDDVIDKSDMRWVIDYFFFNNLKNILINF